MIVHLNGQLLPAADAHVSVFDRGFLFGDGVYEGLRSVVVNSQRRVVAINRHIRRLADGLAALGIDFDAHLLRPLSDQLLDANHADNAFIYWQITRGSPPLDGSLPVRARVPGGSLRPTVFGYCSPVPPLDAFDSPPQRAAALTDDPRWSRGSVKSISLLGNVLAALDAHCLGGEEGILVRRSPAGPLVTEGTYTNVLLALPSPAGTQLVTPSLDSAPILPGVTRDILLAIEPAIIQRPVLQHELDAASEILLLGTTTMVSSVTRLNGRPVGSGLPGPHARRLLDLLVQTIRAAREDINL